MGAAEDERTGFGAPGYPRGAVMRRFACADDDHSFARQPVTVHEFARMHHAAFEPRDLLHGRKARLGKDSVAYDYVVEVKRLVRRGFIANANHDPPVPVLAGRGTGYHLHCSIESYSRRDPKTLRIRL